MIRRTTNTAFRSATAAAPMAAAHEQLPPQPPAGGVMIQHRLGNGFMALVTRNAQGRAMISVHDAKTGQSCPHVLGQAIGMDVTSSTLDMAHIPDGIDVIARLKKLTVCRTGDRPRVIHL